jgi:hypothetical protein
VDKPRPKLSLLGNRTSEIKRMKAPHPGLCLALTILGTLDDATARIWTKTSALGENWNSIASSADGTKLVATAGFTGKPALYLSTNGGTTWAVNLTGAPAYVALSADGNGIAAAGDDPGLFIWPSIPAPILSLRATGAQAVISWLVPSLDLALEQNAALTTPNWTEAPTTPMLNLTNLP